MTRKSEITIGGKSYGAGAFGSILPCKLAGTNRRLAAKKSLSFNPMWAFITLAAPKSDHLLPLLGLIKRRELQPNSRYETSSYYSIMEKADHSLADITNEIAKFANTDPEFYMQLITCLLSDTINAIAQLQKISCIHGDVKSQNVLVFIERGAIKFKLADFDTTMSFDQFRQRPTKHSKLTKEIKKLENKLKHNGPFFEEEKSDIELKITKLKDQASRLQEFGTMEFMAPELFCEEAIKKSDPSKLDIYSLGVMLKKFLQLETKETPHGSPVILTPKTPPAAESITVDLTTQKIINARLVDGDAFCDSDEDIDSSTSYDETIEPDSKSKEKLFIWLQKLSATISLMISTDPNKRPSTDKLIKDLQKIQAEFKISTKLDAKKISRLIKTHPSEATILDPKCADTEISKTQAATIFAKIYPPRTVFELTKPNHVKSI